MRDGDDRVADGNRFPRRADGFSGFGGPSRFGALRQAIRTLEGFSSEDGEGRAVTLGIPVIDAALGGGLACGALHEIAAAREAEIAVATGFALALAGRE